GTVAHVVATVALPVSQAVLAHRRGDFAGALDLMRPILDDIERLGGSHAQQDVLLQLFLDAAVKADRGDDVRLLLWRGARHPVPPERRVGYAEAASRFRQ